MHSNTDYRILNAADFLLMDALCRKPQTTKELTHLTTMSSRTIQTRLKRFKDLGLVMQRYPDRKWVATIVMRVETPRETVQDAVGIAVQDEVEAQVGKRQPEAPTAVLPPPPPKEYIPPKSGVPVSDRASRISKQMRIPDYLIEYGEVTIGKLGQCVKCKIATPVIYGSYNVCPNCARR